MSARGASPAWARGARADVVVMVCSLLNTYWGAQLGAHVTPAPGKFDVWPGVQKFTRIRQLHRVPPASLGRQSTGERCGGGAQDRSACIDRVDGSPGWL